MDDDIHPFCNFYDMVVIIVEPEDSLLPRLFSDSMDELKIVPCNLLFQVFQIFYFKIQDHIILAIEVDLTINQFLKKDFSIKRLSPFEPDVINSEITRNFHIQDFLIEHARTKNIFNNDY